MQIWHMICQNIFSWYSSRFCKILQGELSMAFRPEIRAPQSGDTRRGRGFSFKELRDAGISLADARWMAIPIDSRRKTHHAENVKMLKEYIKRIKKLGKDAKTTKPKAKAAKASPTKPIPLDTDLTELSGVTKKVAETLVTAGVTAIHDLATTSPRRLARKTSLKRNRAEKLVETARQHQREKTKVARKAKTKEPELTELKHLPEITNDDVKKLRELGVETLEDLKTENPRDLSLITGIPETRIKEWRKIIRGVDKK
jgi:predicted flap endonuclease-1-like 5' DNA nuclease